MAIDLGGLLGAVGAVTGCVGIGLSIRSNGIAQRANEYAEAANKLSAESNTIARESNSIAVHANELAQDANEVATQDSVRAGEAHDVHWDHDWQDVGQYAIIKRGEDEALDVRITVSLDDDDPVSAHAERVGQDEAVVVTIPSAQRKLAEDRQERARLQPAPFGLLPFGFDHHAVRVHITWKSSLGNPHTCDLDPIRGPLE